MQADPQLTLDIGGEGRHADAWNLNPSRVKTIGPDRGAPIPRLLVGRADAIPLADNSVECVIVERMPLLEPALREIARVIAAGGEIILRHAVPPGVDPHAVARRLLPGVVSVRRVRVGSQTLQETTFCLEEDGGREATCRIWNRETNMARRG